MAKRWIQYCTRCVMPETRPDLALDAEGVCSACRSFDRRKDIDWDERGRELERLLGRYRRKDGGNYDCIIPVSGGKDSHYQVLTALSIGMNPLCVYAQVDKPSAIGRRNFENMRRLGVDCIEVSTNPVVRNRLDRLTLMEIGDISWAENMAIFTIPVRVAVAMDIPLLIWGENSQDEFGGPAAAAQNRFLDRKWLEEYGGLLGFRLSDAIAKAGVAKKDVLQFVYPGDEEIRRVGVTGIFLGSYKPWDGYAHALLAQGHGFEMWPKSNEGALNNYEHMDNLHAGIHDYFKYLKFGFSRATDHCSLHIRRGRLTRPQALAIVKERDGRFPRTYLETTLGEILADLDMTMEEFLEACDRHTNRDLFKKDADGNLVRRKDGSPEKINDDNVEGASAQRNEGPLSTNVRTRVVTAAA